MTGVKAESLPSVQPHQSKVTWAPWLAWSICVVSLGLGAIALLIIAITFSTPAPDTWGFRGYGTLLATGFAVLGGLSASRNPYNPVAWLTCVIGFLTSVQAFAVEYAVYALLAHPGSLPFGDVMAWFISWVWIVMSGIFAPICLFLFPDGRLLSPRWRVLVWAVPFIALVPIAGFALTPGPLQQFPTVNNPFGIAAFQDSWGILSIGMLLVASVLAVSAVSLTLRFRRSTGIERQQIKWLMYATAIGAFVFTINIIEQVFWRTYRTDILVILGFLAIPCAIGFAMLKYRLYDIDVVINRTLVYVPLTAILAGLYIAGIGVLKSVFTDITGVGSEAAVAFTTLFVVALLTPLKNSLQTVVDKRFRETPDPKKKIRALTEQIRSVVQVLSEEQIALRLLKDASSAYGASYAAVHLRRDETPERVYAQGEDAGSPALSVSLECGSESLGALVMGPRRDGRPYAAEDKAALESCARTVAEALVLAERTRVGKQA